VTSLATAIADSRTRSAVGRQPLAARYVRC
jgi:hypothetical protein